MIVKKRSECYDIVKVLISQLRRVKVIFIAAFGLANWCS